MAVEPRGIKPEESREVLESLGGVRCVASALRLAPSSVHAWTHRGIPRSWALYLRLTYGWVIPFPPIEDEPILIDVEKLRKNKEKRQAKAQEKSPDA